MEVRSSEGLGLSSWSVKFVKHIRAPLLVGLSVRELDGAEAVALVEPARSGVGLKCVEAKRQRQGAQGVGQEQRANAFAYERWIDCHLSEPGNPFRLLRVHSCNYGAFDLRDDDTARRKQLACHPLAKFFVRVRRWRIWHERRARVDQQARNPLSISGGGGSQRCVH